MSHLLRNQSLTLISVTPVNSYPKMAYIRELNPKRDYVHLNRSPTNDLQLQWLWPRLQTNLVEPRLSPNKSVYRL